MLHIGLEGQYHNELPDFMVFLNWPKLPWYWPPFRNFAFATIASVAVPTLFAALFGFLAFRSRIRGVYFSIITQATTVAVALIFRRNETRLCGTNGLTNFETIAGFDLRAPGTKLALYFLTVFTLIVVYVVCRGITRSRLGRLLLAVRDNESRLRFAGYQPVTVKAFAFTAAGVIAGIGGMLYTPQNGIITPFKMEPIESILMVLWVAVGGRGTLAGAVVGSLLVNYVGSFFSSALPGAWPFVQGGLFIAVVLLLPDGIVGAWRKFATGGRNGTRAEEAPPSAHEVPLSVSNRVELNGSAA
jgi:urea transport system permease protein